MKWRPGGPRVAGMMLTTLLCLGARARADAFSPGDLARPHADLTGLTNCTRCHEHGQELSARRCNACHTEIGTQLSSRRGFHGRMAPAHQAACQNCHHDHQGRDTSLIDWGTRGEAGFDHSATGWPLRGKHTAVACASCHQNRRVKEAPILKLLEAHPGHRTFLGLDTACSSCHFDEHRGQLKGPCQSCHDEKGWKPAPGFDHEETGFALRGGHRRVACAKCHDAEKDTTTPADAFPAPASTSHARFGQLPHGSCLDCHSDPHRGQFGARCESCHTADSWHKVRSASTERAFHDKTRFPLKGAHADADCQSCHGPFPGQRAIFRGLGFATCTECHADAHPGQIAEPKTGATCDRCHGLETFLPAKFEAADHARTRYPLEGAHQASPCNGCHAPQPSLLQSVPARVKQTLQRRKRPLAFSLATFDILPKASRCDGCHADPHEGQLTRGETACATCHVVESFHAVSFDHDKDASFPLAGKHRTAACGGCHVPEKPGGPTRYRGAPTTCEACHADPHAGQFAGQRAAAACDGCHGTESFHLSPPSPSPFQHAPPFTDFLLKGKHAELACEKCHPRVAARTAAGATLSVQRFLALPRSCAGCHADPHQGQFREMEP